MKQLFLNICALVAVALLLAAVFFLKTYRWGYC
jgi:hypothetical protein